MLVVVEELDGQQREPARLEQPVEVARGGVQLEQAVCDVRVVVEEAEAARAPVSRRPVQPPVLGGQRSEEERAESPRRVEPVEPLEPVARLGDRRQREPVP